MSLPGAEEDALRVKPVRLRGRLGPSWLGSKTLIALILVMGALFLGAMALVLRESGSLSRGKVVFPAPPQLEAALASAQERLKVNPQDIAAMVELGTLHFQKGKGFYPDAINELEEARELGALDPRIFYCLGIMYQEAGLYPFALEEYKRFLRHYPDDREIRLLEAKLLYKQGNFAQAVSEYERLKFHFPSDPLVEENLGLSLWGAKSLDRALESFNQLKTMGPDEMRRAEFYTGQIYFDRKEYQASLDHLIRCQPAEGAAGFGISPDQAHAALAMAYQKLGRLEEAKAAWELVLREAPGDAKASAALRDVKRRLPSKKKSKTRP